MTDTANPAHAGEAETRRDFLYLLAGGMGAIGTVAAVWPLADSMNPAADVLALSSTEVDLSPVGEGMSITVIWRGNPDLAHTSAARAGVIYLSKTVAVEWAQFKIRTNCVAPGCCESDGFNNYSEEVARRYQLSNPMLHAGDVMDVAEAVVYLAAPAGKFVNGEVITVDGGQQLWGDVWAFEKPEWTKVD